MGRHPGSYRGEKRRQELTRQKKQEEKRQKKVKTETPENGTLAAITGAAPEAPPEAASEQKPE